MLQKLVAIEPVKLTAKTRESLRELAHEIVYYDDLPADDAEIIRRVGDADGMLVSYTTYVRRPAIEGCPNLRYIGMCCSLYAEESASVDIACAREHGIVVTGVRDYGDIGPAEFVVSELVRLLHGFGTRRWTEVPRELTGLRFGVVGLGALGLTIAQALTAFGAQVCYYSRTRKPEAESAGIEYLPLDTLLRSCEGVITCLSRGTAVLGEAEFAALGDHKILFNMGLSPSYDLAAFRAWLARDNAFFCDTALALGDDSLLSHPHVVCPCQSAGMTEQAQARLGDKVLGNLRAFLDR